VSQSSGEREPSRARIVDLEGSPDSLHPTSVRAHQGLGSPTRPDTEATRSSRPAARTEVRPERGAPRRKPCDLARLARPARRRIWAAGTRRRAAGLRRHVRRAV